MHAMEVYRSEQMFLMSRTAENLVNSQDSLSDVSSVVTASYSFTGN